VWHERAVDQRPCVEAEAGVETGDEHASEHLQINKEQHESCDAERVTWAWRTLLRSSVESQPEPKRGAQDQHGDAEMHRKAVLADVDPVDETALYHVPTDRALQTAKHKEARELGPKGTRNIAGPPEKQERQEEDGTDQPPKESMRPFPPIDGLEGRQIHRRVDLRIFRNLPVRIEGALPIGFRERRDGAHDRLPFGDGEA